MVKAQHLSCRVQVHVVVSLLHLIPPLLTLIHFSITCPIVMILHYALAVTAAGVWMSVAAQISPQIHLPMTRTERTTKDRPVICTCVEPMAHASTHGRNYTPVYAGPPFTNPHLTHLPFRIHLNLWQITSHTHTHTQTWLRCHTGHA